MYSCASATSICRLPRIYMLNFRPFFNQAGGLSSSSSSPSPSSSSFFAMSTIDGDKNSFLWQDLNGPNGSFDQNTHQSEFFSSARPKWPWLMFGMVKAQKETELKDIKKWQNRMNPTFGMMKVQKETELII
ncbi:hypothetical protein NE237_010878 [Protea cynaroides]|uniref:Uncharacterized protein n=1 Tax=Protea cynaroides TaxID=273540 RepID=A0A9Q0R1P2_9MAGN|nr:hypothetical protein NE237_010878 [Protea cynaroides]